jgi:glycolate dehydrogenase FAD-binding subunit
MNDVVRLLSDAIREAAGQGRPLCVRGGGTKDFYGGPARGDKLETTEYRGIVSYEPTELVITARAGTRLAEIESALREKGQMLPFEPPHFGEAATLGGCVAAGLSGPRRPYSGAVRDFVLGVRLLDGKGEDLRFGGQVMKNVAGYDISRLMAGSLGTLGVLIEISLKVLPVSPMEATLRVACAEEDGIILMNEWAGTPLPVSATAWHESDLAVRLSGARPAVEAAMKKIGGTEVDPAQTARFWTGIREQTDPRFHGGLPLWRLSVKSTTPPITLPGVQLIEWGGALRWLKSGADHAAVRRAALAAGGHATLFRADDKSAGVFHPLPGALMNLHRRLKRTFDPAGILNPGRMYPEKA